MSQNNRHCCFQISIRPTLPKVPINETVTRASIFVLFCILLSQIWRNVHLRSNEETFIDVYKRCDLRTPTSSKWTGRNEGKLISRRLLMLCYCWSNQSASNAETLWQPSRRFL